MKTTTDYSFTKLLLSLGKKLKTNEIEIIVWRWPESHRSKECTGRAQAREIEQVRNNRICVQNVYIAINLLSYFLNIIEQAYTK